MNSRLQRIKVLLFILLASGSARADDVKTELAALYPNFSASQISGKISAADSPFRFLRSFIPFYYFEIARRGVGQSEIQKLVDQTDGAGWCAGDAHPENFGALLNKNGEPVFSINDFDDAGPCPLAADALRFFTATTLSGKKVDLKSIIKSYLEALKGKDYSFSQPTLDLLEKSRRRGAISPTQHAGLPGAGGGEEELGLDDEGSGEKTPLSTAELTSVTSVLRQLYGATLTVGDAVKFQKLEGGSYGLTRYRVWITLGREQVLIELKQEVRPGIFPLASGAIPGTFERIQKTLLLEQGPDYAPLYTVATVPELGEVLLRPRWKGNLGMSLKDFHSKDLQGVFEDEAALLGSLHRKTAAAGYQATIENVDKSAWEEAAIKMADRISKAFEASRK